MTPYYEQDGITIYHGDCREVLPSLSSVSVTVTSPPYNTLGSRMPARGTGVKGRAIRKTWAELSDVARWSWGSENGVD